MKAVGNHDRLHGLMLLLLFLTSACCFVGSAAHCIVTHDHVDNRQLGQVHHEPPKHELDGHAARQVPHLVGSHGTIRNP
ncbi:hypothetical protein BCR44DRAFT_1439287 [Catenaria anguillulae PL171]|uniref:Secreted protein n=1 Tax=Catenaria anguillulae PL171 TaxID=765915 RepID=A0A1Y2HH38_9FUNG|nr:hypothetical protein BCR44DRAFT_1439287 [Catenaria anguillulae PL171]